VRPLPVPPDAESDGDSIEIVRGWIINGELQIALAAWVWPDEIGEWGRLLADTACHLADAISTETGKSREEVFETISKSLNHYLNNPPENLTGDFAEPVPHD
jgi:hypothetical protein